MGAAPAARRRGRAAKWKGAKGAEGESAADAADAAIAAKGAVTHGEALASFPRRCLRAGHSERPRIARSALWPPRRGCLG